MHLTFSLALIGLLIGFLVGLTGMGGGALLTSVLVLFFRVPPLAAISSDLFVSLVMKPFGAVVHIRQHTVHWRLVGLLSISSAPAAFVGAVIIGEIGHKAGVQDDLKLAIGVALCISVVLTLFRQWLDKRAAQGGGEMGESPQEQRPLAIRPLPTIGIGIVGGFAVGLTSVGAGAVIIALLLLVYPTLRPNQLVGTDMVQAIPLVAAATIGHLLFGDVRFALSTSLLVGAIPGVLAGAVLSARAPGAIIRPAFTGLLLAVALSLFQLHLPIMLTGAVIGLGASALLADRRRRLEPARPEELSEQRCI